MKKSNEFILINNVNMDSGYVFPLYVDESLTALQPEAFKIMTLQRYQPKQVSITCLKVNEIVLDFFCKAFSK